MPIQPPVRPCECGLDHFSYLVSAVWMADEAIQMDAPDEVFASGSGRRPRPRGGNRKAQAARYHLKNRVRRRAYWKLYQAARRAAARVGISEDI
jgi:hypothetical protein